MTRAITYRKLYNFANEYKLGILNENEFRAVCSFFLEESATSSIDNYLNRAIKRYMKKALIDD